MTGTEDDQLAAEIHQFAQRRGDPLGLVGDEDLHAPLGLDIFQLRLIDRGLMVDLRLLVVDSLELIDNPVPPLLHQPQQRLLAARIFR